jgi:tetratricopeptide (TPR) repeat protein
MPDAPAEQKAQGLVNRGFRSGQSGNSERAIADYTAIIDMPDAPNELKAEALFNRGFRWGQGGDSEKAIADYNAVIDMPEAPAERKANAFLNRGWRRFAHLNDASAMVDDSRKAIELAEGNLEARSNLALGLLLTGQAEAARREYESLLARTSEAGVIQAAINDLEEAIRKRKDVPDAENLLLLLRNALPAAES